MRQHVCGMGETVRGGGGCVGLGFKQERQSLDANYDQNEVTQLSDAAYAD